MEIIYIDRLFLINLSIDYFLALGAARVAGLRLRRIRYALCAIFGALYACACVFPSLYFLSIAPVKLAAGIFMSLIAYGGEKKFWRCTIIFFSVSALFGGAVWALSMQNGTNGLYIPLSMPVLIFSFAIIYAVLSLVFNRWGKGLDKKIVTAELSYNGKSAKLRALCDSGNSLYDPITGAVVMISSPDALTDIIPESGLSALELAELHPGKYRLIPYSAVGTSSSLMAAFRPDELMIDGKTRHDVIIAISPCKIVGDGFNSIIDT